jgi:hypothetical protein
MTSDPTKIVAGAPLGGAPVRLPVIVMPPVEPGATTRTPPRPRFGLP